MFDHVIDRREAIDGSKRERSNRQLSTYPQTENAGSAHPSETLKWYTDRIRTTAAGWNVVVENRCIDIIMDELTENHERDDCLRNSGTSSAYTHGRLSPRV